MTILIFSFAQASFGASCRKQVKQSRYKVSQAENSINKAVDYYDRHKNYIDNARFEMAKKYIQLTMERVETGLKRYEIATEFLETTLEKCPRKSKRIYSMLENIQDEVEVLSFKQLIYHQIFIRL